MLTIRQMQPKDADHVRQLEVLSFSPYFRQTGREREILIRSQNNILASIAVNPSGCFVAENDSLVGFVFTRKWGRIGWLGTFGVHPDHQNQGIGHKLLSRAISHLEKSKCKIIGLETMPDSPYNVGLYARACFQPIPPTLILEKHITSYGNGSNLVDLDSLTEKDGLLQIKELCNQAHKGLSYTVEVQNAGTFGWGKTLFINPPAPWGFAIIRTKPRFEESKEDVTEVTAMVTTPKTHSRLNELVSEVETYAFEYGFSKIRIPVNATDWEALQSLLIMHFRVVNLSLRMLYLGSYHPKGVDLSRWAM